MRIASILNEKEITLSCEVFPPKHFDGIAQASAVAQEMMVHEGPASLIEKIDTEGFEQFEQAAQAAQA